MQFQEVLRIPQGVLKGSEDARYLTRDALASLQPHNLLFFLRTANYNVLHDFPCMSASERRLRSSQVEGAL